MPVYDSPLALYKKQLSAFKNTKGTGQQAWRQIPEGGYRDLKEFTSGGISSATLARMGHPYARQGAARRGTSKAYQRRYGKMVAPLLPINRQSGKLNASIRLWRRSSRFSLEESVGFDSAIAGKSIYAVMPKGTRYVVPRGIWLELRKRGMARNRAFRDVYLNGQRAAFAKP